MSGVAYIRVCVGAICQDGKYYVQINKSKTNKTTFLSSDETHELIEYEIPCGEVDSEGFECLSYASMKQYLAEEVLSNELKTQLGDRYSIMTVLEGDDNRRDLSKPATKSANYAQPTNLVKSTDTFQPGRPYLLCLLKQDLVEATSFIDGGTQFGDRKAILKDVQERFLGDQKVNLRTIPPKPLHPAFSTISFRRVDDSGHFHTLTFKEKSEALKSIINVASTGILDNTDLKSFTTMKEELIKNIKELTDLQLCQIPNCSRKQITTANNLRSTSRSSGYIQNLDNFDDTSSTDYPRGNNSNCSRTFNSNSRNSFASNTNHDDYQNDDDNRARDFYENNNNWFGGDIRRVSDSGDYSGISSEPRSFTSGGVQTKCVKGDCDKMISHGDKFCCLCGTSQIQICMNEDPKCGKVVRKGAFFCPYCGFKQN